MLIEIKAAIFNGGTCVQSVHEAAHKVKDVDLTGFDHSNDIHTTFLGPATLARRPVPILVSRTRSRGRTKTISAGNLENVENIQCAFVPSLAIYGQSQNYTIACPHPLFANQKLIFYAEVIPPIGLINLGSNVGVTPDACFPQR